MIWFLLVWLALVLIRPQEWPQYADLGIPILPITMAATLVAWALGRDRHPFNQPTYLLFPVFIVIGCFTMVVSGWAGGAVDRFLNFLPSLIAMVLVAQASQSPRNLTRIMWVVCLAALVLTVHGIEQVHMGAGWTGMPTVQDGRIQYVGIFCDPIVMALLLLIGLPLAMLLSGRGGWLGLRRLFWWALGLALVYGVYLTDSRGAFLAVMAMGGVWIWLKRGVLVAGILGTAGMAVLMMLPTRMQELDAGESSAYGRIETWYDGIQMFIEHPLFGVGVGNFTEHSWLTAHNSFVLVLAETGIFGYTVWLAMVVYCFLMPIMLLRLPADLGNEEYQPLWTQERRVAMTLLIAQVGFYACAFFLSRSYVILLYILLGMVTGWYAGASQRWAGLPAFRVQSDWFKWCVVSVLSIIGLWLVIKVLFVLAGS